MNRPFGFILIACLFSLVTAQTCPGNCTRHSVPSFFWDYFLLPQTTDDITEQLEILKERLEDVNEAIPDFDLLDSPVSFGLTLEHNARVLNEKDPSTGCLVPLEEQLNDLITDLRIAIRNQEISWNM